MVLASTCARWAEAVSKASGEGQEAAGARVHLVSTLARRSVPSPSTATLAARLRHPLRHPWRLFSAGGRRVLRVSIGQSLVVIGAASRTYLSVPFPCIPCLVVCCGLLTRRGAY